MLKVILFQQLGVPLDNILCPFYSVQVLKTIYRTQVTMFCHLFLDLPSDCLLHVFPHFFILLTEQHGHPFQPSWCYLNMKECRG